MAVIDLITGLAFVDARVGLKHLDRDLRASLKIRPEDAPAEQQLATLNAQLADLEKKIEESKKQADRLYKRGAYTQSTEVQGQTTQLYTQIQKLQVDRPRLESESRLQRRSAEDEELLRMIADLYTQATTAKQGERYLDFALVTLAMFRVHRQVYPDIAEGEGRLRLTELQDKLFEELREVIGNPDGRDRVAADYAAALQGPLGLHQRAAQATAETQAAVAAVEPLRAAPADAAWAGKVAAAGACRAGLDKSQAAVAALLQESTAFNQDPNLPELFFPAAGAPVADVLGGLKDEWAAVLDTVDKALGIPVSRLQSSLQGLPADLGRWQAEVGKAQEETDRLRVTHELGGAVLHLADATRAYQARYQELAGRYQTLQPGQGAAVQLAGTWLALEQLRAALAADFKGYAEFVDAADFAKTNQYGLAAAARLKAIGAAEDIAPVAALRDAFTLRSNVAKLEADVARGLAACRRGIDKSLASLDEFTALEQHLRGLLDDAGRAQADTRIAEYQPDVLAQARSALRGEQGKEIDRRDRVVDVLLEAAVAAQAQPPADLPPVAGGPALPALGTRQPGLLGRLPRGRTLWLAIGAVVVALVLLALAIAAATGAFGGGSRPAATATPRATPAVTRTPEPTLATAGGIRVSLASVHPSVHMGQIYLLSGPTGDAIVSSQRSDSADTIQTHH